VAAADAALTVAFLPARAVRRMRSTRDVRRILLLRLERIGDLLMTVPAIQAVRALAPKATIDLVVGSWNEPLARLMSEVDRVEVMDASWLARASSSEPASALVRRSLGWRSRGYDLAINFEPDIRSHLLMALSGATRRIGFDAGGGGPTLTRRLRFDPTRHTAALSLALVASAFDRDDRALEAEYLRPIERSQRARISVPPTARTAAADRLDGAPRPLVAVHASGGRPIKQWPPERFGDVAARLASDFGASIVLTGSADDRDLVDAVRKRIPASARVIDLTGTLDLVGLAAVLQHVSILITGDSGPMHVADAVQTPVVAIFGLSDPRRYRPLLDSSRVVRIDLVCSPCNRVRLPPERCVGHTPDCLRGIQVEDVVLAAASLLRASAAAGGDTESGTPDNPRVA
jgi:lipopolysaccharide heptosyltransferase II